MKRWEISALEASWLLAGAISLTGHVSAAPQLIEAGGRDAWITGIIALPLGALGLWSWYRLSRIFPGKTVVEYLPKVMGYFGYLVAGIYVLYFLTALVFTLRLTTDWLVDAILPETPSWVMGLLYMAAVVYACLGGLDVIARVNQFHLPLLTLFGTAAFIGTLPSKDYRLLFPLFERGPVPVLVATLLSAGYLGEVSVAAMFSAYIRPKDRGKPLLRGYMFALLYVVMTTTGPLAGSIASMGYRMAANMPYPTFQQLLMVSFSRFFERTDLLGVHLWLAGAYVRCGLYLLLVADGLTILGNQRKSINWVLAGLALSVVVTSEILFPDKPSYDLLMSSLYLPASALLGVALPPLFLAVAYLRGLHRQKAGVAYAG